MRTGAIIQARMSSTRLPGKVMKDLPFGSGTPVLVQVVRRTQMASTLDTVIVATSTGQEDDVIAGLCEERGILCFRGSLEDVLSRYYHAAVAYELDVVVRVTSDCPCIDPEVIDMVVAGYRENDVDFATNAARRTFPHGFDLEVASFEALRRTYEKATTPYEREHVFPYLTQGRRPLVRVTAADGWYAPDIRITLDTPRDYALLCAVYDYLGPDFKGRDIIELFDEKPWLKLVNAEDASQIQ